MADLTFGEELVLGATIPDVNSSHCAIQYIRDDGSRQQVRAVALATPAVVDELLLSLTRPGHIALFWGQAAVSSNPRGGQFLPYPTDPDPQQNPRPVPSYSPVNQIPWLEGGEWGDADGNAIVHNGWMRDICRIAHEALTWDDRQLGRLHKQSHSHEPDIAHTADTRNRARLALKYGRLLTGHAFSRLDRWSESDPTLTGWQNDLPRMADMMSDICDGVCVNPHWMLDFALNIDVDAWDDALNEQAALTTGQRRIVLPKVDKSGSAWQPDLTTLFYSFETTLNPLRKWEDLLVRFADAVARYNARYATRGHG